MNASPQCPNPARLAELLHGRLSEHDQVELSEHLEACPQCQQRLDELAANPQAWSDARQMKDRPAQHGPALRRVIERLKRPAQPGTEDELPADEEIPLNFLSPSDNPEFIGLLGPYRIRRVIGRGGNGIVFEALDPALQRVVAVKVLAPHLAWSGAARRRFTREAQAAAAVCHEHVVTIHAVDEANGVPYLVMQYINGISLQERIDRSGPLEPKEILRIGMQAATGLAAAHAQGLIHRDVKPANILLENGIERVKLTDFGLARAVDDAVGLTQTGVVSGTPEYMAPEQARGEAMDHRADLFSLGSVLYAMCTGRASFRAPTPLAVLRRVSDETPRPIRDINPEVPEWLAAIIARLHAKAPADRYQSAKEVADVLGQRLAQLQQANWTPPPEPTSEVASPMTSVTICPLCGGQLHVPERLIGRVVKCPQCGKPFEVPASSQEIEVVRGLPPEPRTPVKRGALLLYGVLGLVAVLGLLFFSAIVLYMWMASARQAAEAEAAAYQQRQEASRAGRPGGGQGDPRMDGLAWFPADVTLCGHLDRRAFGPLTLDSEFTRAFRAKLPAERAIPLTKNRLGSFEIDRFTFACGQGPERTKQSRWYARLTGSIDRQRLTEFIRREFPEVQVQEERGPENEPITLIGGRRLQMACALVGDTDVLLACYGGERDPDADDMELIRQMLHVETQQSGAAPGNDRWLSEASLAEGSLARGLLALPTDSCAFLLGRVPPVERQQFAKEGITCPERIALYLRQDAALTLHADVSFAESREGKAFAALMARWQEGGVADLLKLAPGITPQAGEALRKTFAGIHFDEANANAGSVNPIWREGQPDAANIRLYRLQVEISPEALRAFWDVLKQVPWGGSVEVRAPREQAAELKKLEGTWETTELIEDGIKRVRAQFANKQWTFQGNRYTFKEGSIPAQGTLELEVSKDPKWITLHETPGGDPAVPGGTYLGIYQFDGNQLVLCFAPEIVFAGSIRERPTEFTSRPGSGQTYYVLKRKKN